MPEELQLYGFYVVHICDFGMLRVNPLTMMPVIPQAGVYRESLTFAPATIAPMVNANTNHNPNPNSNTKPNSNLNPYPTLNQKLNHNPYSNSLLLEISAGILEG